MAKYIGITTNPTKRKQEREYQYPFLKSWRIVKENLTYNQAQELENKYIARKYKGNPGGKPKKGSLYSVYTFKA